MRKVSREDGKKGWKNEWGKRRENVYDVK